VEFEITGGLPGTADDEPTNPSDDLRLKDLPFEQPEADEDEPPVPNNDMSSLENSTPDAFDDVSPAISGGLAGLAVGRFRKRQRQAVREVTEQRYSRASRFSRRHS